MSDPFVGEIRIFAGDYAPYGWAFCDGGMLQVQQNTLLFAIIGNRYGGDGRQTFQLPDLRGRVAMAMGSGPNLTPRVIAQKGGVSAVTLLQSEMPNHTHTANCQTVTNQSAPAGNVWASSPARVGPKVYATPPDTEMSPLALAPTGGDQPHNNMQPFVSLNFIIALVGLYPPRP